MLKHNFLLGIIIGAIGGVIIGALGGAAAGVLMAPQSGKKTRAKLREQVDELGETIKDKSQDILKAGRHQLNTVLQRGNNAA